MRSTCVVIVATLFVLHHTASAADGQFCNDARGQPGNCRNIKTCDVLLKLLRKYGYKVGDYLRASACGYENRDPLVCCPFNNDYDPDNNDNPNGNDNDNPNRNDDNNNNNRPGNNDNNGSEELPKTNYGPLQAPVCGTTDTKFTKVVGGVPTKLGAWPWIAVLGYRGKRSAKPRWLCGGTLISSRHILTAGHCVYDQKDLFQVRLGDLDLERDDDGARPIDVAIEKRTIHPEYNPVTYVNDIAVLRLQQDVRFTDLIKPICLPIPDNIRYKDLTGYFPFLIGWGSVYFHGPSSPLLQQLQVPVVSPDQCKAAFRSFPAATIDDRVMCAGFARGGKDACQGDSGGPLMSPVGKSFYIVGVVSYGFKCAEPGYYGVYTKVTAFLDFVVSQLN